MADSTQLPNGFTGFANKRPNGFTSAADAVRAHEAERAENGAKANRAAAAGKIDNVSAKYRNGSAEPLS